MNEYNEPFPIETFDANTLKLLDEVCKDIDVPSDEEIEEVAIAYGEQEDA